MSAERISQISQQPNNNSRKHNRVDKTDPQNAPLCIFLCFENQQVFVGDAEVTVPERITSCQTFSGPFVGEASHGMALSPSICVSPGIRTDKYNLFFSPGGGGDCQFAERH